MNLAFRTILFLLVTCTYFISSSCSDDMGEGTGRTFQMIPTMSALPVLGMLTPEEYEQKCIRHEWYFCDLNANEKMMVTKDVCVDPPVVLDVGECIEFLECDPTNYNMGTIACVALDGFPGTQEKLCDKGKIKYTDCVSMCSEEVCDEEDNDCDGFVDEGQLNACNRCGILPSEVCDGFDDDCDGFVDEGLVQECFSSCGSGVEYCVLADWVSCSAPPAQDEICDGFDNNCNGQVDEGLDCECTTAQVGTLFPCSESPLICGEGYKTCACLDTACTEMYTTDCMAACAYFSSPGDFCDPTVGQPKLLEECNNFDDDCDQQIDEDLFVQCYTGDQSTVFVGICQPGYMTCLAGSWGEYFDNLPNNFVPGFCKGEITPQEDICNGVDDDCDGVTDTGKELDPVDLTFIVDWSGSMDNEIYAVMGALNKFAAHYSDEEVLQWGIILGPVVDLLLPMKEHLKLYHNLTGFTDFLFSMSQLNISSYAMSGSKEMLMDALYLSMHNLVGIPALPYALAEISWATVYGISESAPPLNAFSLDWRGSEVKKVIVLFTDEKSQTYMNPELGQSVLLELIPKIPNTKIYIFSRFAHKKDSYYYSGWEPLCLASGGKWYELHTEMILVYNDLMEIIDENACE